MLKGLRRLVWRNRHRATDEEGAVTVDWVVLSAAIIGIAAGAYSSISEATTTLSGSIGEGLSTKTVDNGD